MTQREKMIAGAVGVVVLLGGGFLGIAKPYWLDARVRIQNDINKEQKQLTTSKALIASVPDLTKEWNAMRDKGLVDDLANAGAKLQDAILALARRSRVDAGQVRVTRIAPLPKTEFTELKMELDGSGTSRGIWPFIYALEDSQLPVRIDSVEMRARKDGVDDLTVQINITTLVHFNPTTPGKTTTRPATRGASTRSTSTRAATGPESRPAPLTEAELEAKLRALRAQEMKDSGTATQPAVAQATTQPTATQPSTQPSPTGGVR